MSLTEVVLAVTTVLSIATAIVGFFRERNKPVLDQAQAENALVNSDSVKQQIKRMSDESNMRRDLRVLDLEDWADRMRPWASSVREKYEMMYEMVREVLWSEGKEMPPNMHLPEPPEFPKPRPLG